MHGGLVFGHGVEDPLLEPVLDFIHEQRILALIVPREGKSEVLVSGHAGRPLL